MEEIREKKQKDKSFKSLLNEFVRAYLAFQV